MRNFFGKMEANIPFELLKVSLIDYLTFFAFIRLCQLEEKFGVRDQADLKI